MMSALQGMAGAWEYEAAGRAFVLAQDEEQKVAQVRQRLDAGVYESYELARADLSRVQAILSGLEVVVAGEERGGIFNWQLRALADEIREVSRRLSMCLPGLPRLGCL